MPKVGMEKLRKKQLIEATLVSVERHGLQGTTIMTISKIAGVSAGIISHYFGGKQALLEATVRHLLDELKIGLLESVNQQDLTPKQRLMAVVDTNFTPSQSSDKSATTWLAFWAQSMHEPGLLRLQSVNAARLESNLRYSLRALIQPQQVDSAAKQIAAMIDGFWLRCALTKQGEVGFEAGRNSCKTFIELIIEKYGL